MGTLTFRLGSRKIALAAIILAVTVGFSPQQSRAEGLNWMIAPYLWASDVGMDVVVNDDPVIGTEVGGIPDFLRDKENGLFCEVDNPSDLASKIQLLLSDQDLMNSIKLP